MRRSIGSKRRIAAAAVGALGGAAAVAAGAFGASSFGTRYVANSHFYGSRASISVPSARFVQAPDEILLHRAVVQNELSDPNPAGLIQAGVYRSGSSAHLDECAGTNDAHPYREFTERHRIRSGTNGFKCRLFRDLPPGSRGEVFSVVRRSARGQWFARVGSLNDRPYDLGFNTAFPMIGGEINGGGGTKRSRTSARYGATGAWEIFRAINARRARRVTGRDHTSLLVPSDGRWRVPSPPTPFTITH